MTGEETLNPRSVETKWPTPEQMKIPANYRGPATRDIPANVSKYLLGVAVKCSG